ncbi:MAG: serine/threonine-protein kinase [Planctomycetota bacterium]
MTEGLWEKIIGKLGGGLTKYTLLNTISKGSMSVVYAGADSHSNVYAIKIINKDARALAERLTREYRKGKSEGELTCGFDHPNIVKGVEWGRSRKGEFLVMEMLKGDLMRDRIRSIQEQVNASDFSLLIRLGSALAYVHECGYIHRDFSPRNVFVLPDGQPKLFDFGLAILTEVAQDRAGNRTGAPSYMAPELIRRLRTDHRTDIYSYGVMLFEVATGRRPVQGEGTIEKILQMLNTKIPEPKEFRPDVDPELNRIIVKAMQRDPRDRWDTVTDLVAELRQMDKSGVNYDEEYAEHELKKEQKKAQQGATPH